MLNYLKFYIKRGYNYLYKIFILSEGSYSFEF